MNKPILTLIFMLNLLLSQQAAQANISWDSLEPQQQQVLKRFETQWSELSEQRQPESQKTL